jgi:DNA-binding transcriptional regulator YdaS (Cro superfamily)
METLKQYLEGRSKADFARQIGVSASQLSQYLSGVRRPGYDRMILIERMTSGQVPIAAWAAPSGASQ